MFLQYFMYMQETAAGAKRHSAQGEPLTFDKHMHVFICRKQLHVQNVTQL